LCLSFSEGWGTLDDGYFDNFEDGYFDNFEDGYFDKYKKLKIYRYVFPVID
jgi:hypothetical protein